jgi:hypothetical protein
MGYHLTQYGRRFQIVDAGPEIGHVWRSRWDSLRLFTSESYDTLPGLPFPAVPSGYPGKDDVAAIYIGFSVADGRRTVLALEIGVAPYSSSPQPQPQPSPEHPGSSWPDWPDTDSKTSGNITPTT